MKDNKNLEEHQPEQENQPMPIAAEVQASPRNNPEVCVQMLKDPEDLSEEELRDVIGGLSNVAKGAIAGGAILATVGTAVGITYGVKHFMGHSSPSGGIGSGGEDETSGH